MKRPAWIGRKERGSPLLIRFMVWLTLRLGWSVGYVLLFPITLYFFLFWPEVRSASRRFLARVLDHPVAARDVFRHMHSAASVMMERLFLLSGRLDRFRIDIEGLDHLTRIVGSGRGCLLFGAHFGSFEVLRAFGRRSPVPVKALMYRANAGAYSRLMEQLDPRLREDIIEIGRPDAMLRVRDCAARGEIVGILADRSAGPQKSVDVPFLGQPAPFPTGPVIVASMLGTPVMLFFGVRKGPRHYEVWFEPFADRVALAAGSRASDLRDWVGRYAGRLEAQCREHPFNWFNFYDFWEHRPNAASQALARAPLDGDAGALPARGGAVLAPR